MKRISIRDIAREAGVVPSTVSFVLNGKAKQMRISDRVAERIKVLAEELGYSPHHTAVSLRTGKSNILGLIVEDISNVFFASLAKIIEEEAYKLGYRIVYCSTENDDKKGCELIRMMNLQQVDGLMITPSPGMEKPINMLISEDKPVVLMDRFFPGSEIPYILVDNYEGVRTGMEHLFKKGYRRIAYVTVDLGQIQMIERERAYKESLEIHSIPFEKSLLLTLDYNLKAEQAVAAIGKLLKDNPDIDAVFFATNYLGVYGLESIKKLGLKIPEDIAVICFDDHDIFRLFTPGITIVQQPIEEIARTAVQLLLKQMANKNNPKDLQRLLQARLIEREST